MNKHIKVSVTEAPYQEVEYEVNDFDSAVCIVKTLIDNAKPSIDHSFNIYVRFEEVTENGNV